MNDWKESRRSYRRFLAMGNLLAARDCLRTAINQITEQDKLELAGMYNQLAKVSLQINDPISAENAAQKSIEVEMQYGPPPDESDRIAAYHVMLADALKQQHKYSAALRSLERGITLYSVHLSKGDELLANLEEFRKSLESERWRESD